MAVVVESHATDNAASQAAYPRRQQPPLQPERASAGPPPGWFGPCASKGRALPSPALAAPARRFPGHFVPHRLCNHFTAHGWCRKADACTFAHGLQELHPDVQAQVAPQMARLQPAACKGKGKGKGGGKWPGMAQSSQFEFSPDAAFFAVDESLFKFNVGASPFVPSVGVDATDAPDKADLFVEDTTQESGVSSDGASTSCSPARRPIPAPLQLDDSPSRSGPKKVAGPAAVPSMASPMARTVVVQPMASPVRISTTRIVAGSPLASPTRAVVVSPSGQPLPGAVILSGSVRSPTGAAAAVLRSPTAALWPGSPTSGPAVPPSPAVVTATPTGGPIPRQMMLQARTVVQRLEQGPPGLAQCAPTPTTKAHRFGFRYPAPGWVVTKATR